MELTLIYTIVGFALAGWSVIANDSIQTLGTFIASKQKWFKWYTLAASASAAMIVTISFGWWIYDGDISYGRLTRIPYQEIQWYHAVAPGILLLLTRVGIPVSTTFLVLSAFASTVVLEKMLIKALWVTVLQQSSLMFVGLLFLNTLMKNSMKLQFNGKLVFGVMLFG